MRVKLLHMFFLLTLVPFVNKAAPSILALQSDTLQALKENTWTTAGLEGIDANYCASAEQNGISKIELFRPQNDRRSPVYVTVAINGTTLDKDAYLQQVKQFAQQFALQKKATTAVFLYDWTKETSDAALVAAGKQLAQFINYYFERDDTKKIILVSHEYGCNVANFASNEINNGKKGKRIELMIHFACPLRSKESANDALHVPNHFKKLLSFYSLHDLVKVFRNAQPPTTNSQDASQKYHDCVIKLWETAKNKYKITHKKGVVYNISTRVNGKYPSPKAITIVSWFIPKILLDIKDFTKTTDLKINVHMASCLEGILSIPETKPIKKKTQGLLERFEDVYKKEFNDDTWLLQHISNITQRISILRPYEIKKLQPNTWRELDPIKELGIDQKFMAESTISDVTDEVEYTVTQDGISKIQLYIPDVVNPNAKPYVFIGTHGTWAPQAEKFNKFDDVYFEGIKNFAEQMAFINHAPALVVSYAWTGANKTTARKAAGEKLADFINTYLDLKSQKLICVSHSHGCNVVNIASNHIKNGFIELIIHYASPIREDDTAAPYIPTHFKKLLSFYSIHDPVQMLGENTSARDLIDKVIRPFSKKDYPTTSKPERLYKKAAQNGEVYNIDTLVDGSYPSHSFIVVLSWFMPEILSKLGMYEDDHNLIVNVNTTEESPVAYRVTLTIDEPTSEELIIADTARQMIDDLIVLTGQTKKEIMEMIQKSLVAINQKVTLTSSFLQNIQPEIREALTKKINYYAEKILLAYNSKEALKALEQTFHETPTDSRLEAGLFRSKYEKEITDPQLDAYKPSEKISTLPDVENLKKVLKPSTAIHVETDYEKQQHELREKEIAKYLERQSELALLSAQDPMSMSRIKA